MQTLFALFKVILNKLFTQLKIGSFLLQVCSRSARCRSPFSQTFCYY